MTPHFKSETIYRTSRLLFIQPFFSYGEGSSPFWVISNAIRIIDPLANRLNDFGDRCRAYKEQSTTFDEISIELKSTEALLTTLNSLLSAAGSNLVDQTNSILKTNMDRITGQVNAMNPVVAELMEMVDG